MKLLGLIGGMSWESTALYYRGLNEAVKRRLGGYHSANLILYSVDFAAIERHQRSGNWDAAGECLAGVARLLEEAGAQAIVLCTNTMHCVAPRIETEVHIPLLHIIDATATSINSAGLSTVGLLGTRFTMEQAFYKDRLTERFGIRVVIPKAESREIIHRIIYEELVFGKVLPRSRTAYRRVIDDLVSRGAAGIVLGCTEIAMLIRPTDVTVPLFDTTHLHVEHAAAWTIDAV